MEKKLMTSLKKMYVMRTHLLNDALIFLQIKVTFPDLCNFF